MSDVIIFDRMQQRRGTTANLASVNEVLRVGEFCVELTTGKFKIGDGTTAWNSLPYVGIWTLADIRAALDLLGSTATGDIIYKGASGWTRLAKGADGQVLTLASGIPSWASGGSGGAMTLIGSGTVAGAAATSFSSPALDLSLYKAFKVICRLDNATASNATVSLYFNSDTTAANYSRQLHTAIGTGLTGGSASNGVIGTMIASETFTGEWVTAKDRDGKPRSIGHVSSNAASAVNLGHFAHGWNSATNVTGITLLSSVASAFAIGSTFDVFGLS